MAAKANPTTITFPNQQEIVDFYNQRTSESFVANVIKYIQNGIEKTSQFFASKTMSRDQIESNVCSLFGHGISDEESKKVAFKWCVGAHTKILQDLFDKAASISSKGGATVATKQVADLTKEKS